MTEFVDFSGHDHTFRFVFEPDSPAQVSDTVGVVTVCAPRRPRTRRTGAGLGWSQEGNLFPVRNSTQYQFAQHETLLRLRAARNGPLNCLTAYQLGFDQEGCAVNSLAFSFNNASALNAAEQSLVN